MALLGDAASFTDPERMAIMRLFRQLEARRIAPIAVFALGANGDTFALFNSRLEWEHCDALGKRVDEVIAAIGLHLTERSRQWPQ